MSSGVTTGVARNAPVPTSFQGYGFAFLYFFSLIMIYGEYFWYYFITIRNLRIFCLIIFQASGFDPLFKLTIFVWVFFYPFYESKSWVLCVKCRMYSKFFPKAFLKFVTDLAHIWLSGYICINREENVILWYIVVSISEIIIVRAPLLFENQKEFCLY